MHKSVLFDESIAALNIKPGGIYIDGTFGRGGHSQEILNRLGSNGRLYAFDKDPDAICYSKEIFANEKRFVIVQDSFANLKQHTDNWGISARVDGILLDLGVSSPQLDDASRGFSFLRDGPLDMRMNPQADISAAQWLASEKEAELAKIFKEYGEERYAKRIARAIVKARNESAITTTKQLANIVADSHPAWEKHKHPATRVFQAIRIYINKELADLEQCLAQSIEVLTKGGRLAVISFHSLEDRIVKRFIQQHVKGDEFPHDLPVMNSVLKQKLKKVGKLIIPSDQEIDQNPRARSARLRVAELLG